MVVRLLIHDDLIYEGKSMLVPRVGEVIAGVTNSSRLKRSRGILHDDATVTVTLLVGDRPYTF